jgi:glucose/arabinose dehydrogenase
MAHTHARSRAFLAVATTAALALVFVIPAAQAAPIPPVDGVQLVEAWPDVSFTRPMGVVNAGDGTDMLYVFEQAGKIHRIPKWRGEGEVPEPSLFLDIKSRVFARFQGGILDMTFHPDFARNARFYVSYLAENLDAAGNKDPRNPFKIVIQEFRSSGATANPATGRAILEIPKSRPNHNSGALAFGPTDGMLYISTGDNQKVEEAVNLTSQNPLSLLGKILRIDVNRADPGLAYAIPSDNPWTGAARGVRREIYAYGMRNPWRMSFDGSGALWVGEPGTTGPGCREWITRVQSGGNHGWPFFEGTRPLQPIPPQLSGARFVRPVYEYLRGADENMTAIIGGFFYAGDRCKPLRGQYIFGDFGRGEVYALRLTPAGGSDLRRIGSCPNLSSIGRDAQGELYFCALEAGLILTMTPN